MTFYIERYTPEFKEKVVELNQYAFAGFEVFEDGTMNVYISDHNAEEIDKFSDLCDNMEIEYKIV